MDVSRQNWFLYFCAFGVNVVLVCFGSMLVWTSPVIPKLQSNDTLVNPIGRPLTVWELSILTATYPLGLVTGTIVIGKVPDLIGRKWTLIWISIGALFSCIGLYLATNIYTFFIFKYTVSVSLGGGPILVPMYTSEIAEDHNRGRLGFFMTFGIIFGELYGNVVGAVTSVSTFSLLCGIPAVLSLVCCMYLPESPEYLLMKGRKNEAILALKKLRKHKPITEIENECLDTQNMVKSNCSTKSSFLERLQEDKGIRKGFYLAASVLIIQNSAGPIIVAAFLNPILSEAAPELNGDILSVIVVSLKFSAAFVGTYIVDRVGRRVLILIALFVCGTSMFGLGLYFYFQHNHYEIPFAVKMVPVLCLICFVIVFSIGLSCIPYTLVAELLPSDLRSLGSSICQFLGDIFSISTAFAYPLAANYFGEHYCMFYFCIVNLSGCIFLYFFLPETKGKSFLEITNILSN
ncbi:facilitated trehalose transporter Tret1-like [Diabrotica virgifera virgifera]|uniref:Major facilitator superfamily (MFS) profile domain-containing protein n=1 Tax=Diabrotica virgifera virgifera TaxID=50390 RepID=A0ABM5INJ8_DIAVI|nr:facilitated trehalose transporter Tret1-like [Diabrotica virgifera virgifera]